jgi:hypothetical protein
MIMFFFVGMGTRYPNGYGYVMNLISMIGMGSGMWMSICDILAPRMVMSWPKA